MSGAGQGLMLQITTVLPSGKGSESGPGIAQYLPDSAANTAEFGQILAEKIAGRINPESVVGLAMDGSAAPTVDIGNLIPDALSEAVAKGQAAVDERSASDAGTSILEENIGQPAQVTREANGDLLPPGGEVLPVIATSEGPDTQQLIAGDLEQEEDGGLNPGLPGAATDNGLPIDPVTDNLPAGLSASFELPGNDSINGRAFTASLARLDGNPTPAGVVPTAVPQSLGIPAHAAVLQRVAGRPGNAGQTGSVKVESLPGQVLSSYGVQNSGTQNPAYQNPDLQSPGLQAPGHQNLDLQGPSLQGPDFQNTGSQNAGFQNSGLPYPGLQNSGSQSGDPQNPLFARTAAAEGDQDNLLVKTSLDATKAITDTQGIPSRLVVGGESVEPRAASVMTQYEVAPRMDFNVASTGRSAALGYGQAVPDQPVSTGVQVPFGQKGWTDAVIERVFWLSGQRVNNAEIHLDPPGLGPLQLQISSKGDQASIFFSSSHAPVRDALEQGLPRLREMLESTGLQLTEVNVSDRSLQQQAQEYARKAPPVAQDALATNEGIVEGESAVVRIPLGLVDHYV